MALTADPSEIFRSSNPTGQEVALAAVTPLVHALKQVDADVSALPSEIELHQSERRIGWRQFSALLDEAAQCFTDSELEAIGASGLKAERYRLRVWFARAFLTVEDAYRLLVYPHRKTD